MKLLRYILLCSCAAALCSCGSGEPASKSATGEVVQADLNSAVLLDVRSLDEFASGHLEGALNIPHDRIADEIATVVPDKSAQVVLYCRSGRRAQTALKTMQDMGYANVVNLGGLEDAQERLGRPVVK